MPTYAGDASNNVLIGLAADDILYGLDGDDTLKGGGGGDSLTGGVGDDSIEGGGGSGDVAVFSGDIGEYDIDYDFADKTTVRDLRDFVLVEGTASEPDLRTLELEGTDTIQTVEWIKFGERTFHVAITGTTADLSINNIICGSAGIDTIDGANGDDYIIGGAGPDSLIGGMGNDTIRPGDISGTADGGEGRDVLDMSDLTFAVRKGGAQFSYNPDEKYYYTAPTGISGETTIVMKADPAATIFDFGANSLSYKNFEGFIGTPYDDSIYALLGSTYENWLDGRAGNDFLLAGQGSDTILGGTGDDLIQGMLDRDSLLGGQGDDVLVGENNAGGSGYGSDVYALELEQAGAAGLDYGPTSDTMEGGLGNDTIRSASGDDRLNYARGDGIDAVQITTYQDETYAVDGVQRNLPTFDTLTLADLADYQIACGRLATEVDLTKWTALGGTDLIRLPAVSSG